MALRESFVGHLRLEKQGWAYITEDQKKKQIATKYILKELTTVCKSARST